jgi:hypothetical protein
MAPSSPGHRAIAGFWRYLLLAGALEGVQTTARAFLPGVGPDIPSDPNPSNPALTETRR